MDTNYDFSGWATKNNVVCSDGRIIRKNAFQHNDGDIVPLVWNHQHGDIDNVLGHVLLKNKDEGVFAYGYLNDSDRGATAKKLLKHGDIKALSIYANRLKQTGNDVVHGAIREVSLVLAGANPGATIDTVLAHNDLFDEEAVITFVGEEGITMLHADDSDDNDENEEDETTADNKTKTIQDVIDTMNEDQENVLYALVGKAYEDGQKNANNPDDEGDDEMKHNVFDQDGENASNVLSHAETEEIFKDAKRLGSLKEAVLAHSVDTDANPSMDFSSHYGKGNMPAGSYGIDDIDWLFPEVRALSNTPEFIKRNDEWVNRVMQNVHKTPFSRIKSIFADITEDEARAKGYTKGKKKIEEVFTLLKRSTTPQTIYKKQKLDRDDIIDITDFDVVAYIKNEMRGMLDEEIARAILVGDGRSTASDDKIDENHIRPIWKDDDLFSIKKLIDTTALTTDDAKAKAYIRAAIKARKDYKGSGNPVLFTTDDILTDMLLLEDANGRVIYDSQTKLETALRVSSIVTVPVMEGLTREVEGATHNLVGIIVNLADYNVGADKGGAVSMFDDFDIDYNQQKYLIETRCSGALIKPFSAIVIESK